MRFTTTSGAEYILNNIETQIEATGESCPSVGPQGIPVRVVYTGSLLRVGVPVLDIWTGKDLDTEKSDEFHQIEFISMPEIGVRFIYYHPLWAKCYSTPVTEITS